MAKSVLSDHPSREKLQSFGLGRLQGEVASAVEAHVVQCPACCRTLAEIGGDTLLDLLRAAHRTPPLPGESGPRPSRAPPHLPEQGATIASSNAAPASANHEPPPAELPPELANHPRYRVCAVLGTGGMGTVYKAEHRLMERTVALKVMSHGLESAGMVERFHREVKAASRLCHPNIVTAHDAEQAGGIHFLVMEYVEGIHLLRLLAERGPLPVQEACNYIRQAALGLQHAHEHSMIHRDIKPHNLMRTPQGVVKILDFGLARLAGDTASRSDNPTAPGTVLGTVDYMAPEQADDAHEADIRSDIYSLGCTLYHLLSGRPPFPKGTVVQKIMAHTERQPRPLQDLRPDLPPGLARIAERMMAKAPSRRYQTPGEVAAALEPFARAIAVTPLVSSPLPRSAGANGGTARMPQRQRSHGRPVPITPTRRWPLILAAALPVLFAALVAGAVAVYRIQTDHGELVITTNNPDVEVVVRQNGKVVRIIDTKTGKEVTLNSGQYELELKDNAAGLKLIPDRFTILRGETVIARVERGPRPPTPAGQVTEIRRLKAHTQAAADLAFTPDGKTLISVGDDDMARSWDLATGEERPVEQRHNAKIHSVVVTPDGKTVATSDWAGQVKVWDLATGKEKSNPAGHQRQARGLAFSPDGSLLYSGGTDENIVRVYETATGKTTAELQQPDNVRALALSPDGKVLAVSLFGGGPITLWDTATRKSLRTLEGHTGTINAVTFSPDNKTLFSGGADGIIRRWDIASGKLLSTLEGQSGPVERLAISRDGATLVSGSGQWDSPLPGTLGVWDVVTGKRTQALSLAGGCVHAVAFAPDARTFASGERDGTVRLWRLPATLERLPPPPAQKVGEVRRFDGHEGSVRAAIFSADGRLVLSCSGPPRSDRTLRLWEAATEKEVRRFEGHTGEVDAVALSPDGRLAVSGSEDQTVRVWDVTTGKELRQLEGEPGRVVAVAFSPDGKQVLTGSHDRTMRLWDAATGKEVRRFERHQQPVQGVAFSPDGKTLASASWDNTIRLWDAASGKELRQLNGHSDMVHGVAFSPDGTRVLSGGLDRALRLWDVATGKDLRVFAGHEDRINGVAYSPDGRRVLSAAGDRTVRVWDVETGKQLASFSHTEPVWSVATSADGAYAVSASEDGTARVWRLPPPLSVVQQGR
jgi:WD40 repeat protein